MTSTPPSVEPVQETLVHRVRERLDRLLGSTRGADAELAHGRAYRFATRARALFYARLAFLAIGLGVLAVRPWAEALGTSGAFAFIWYGVMLLYASGSFLAIDRPYARPLTFVTLCLDLLTLVYLITASGGLHSPLMPTQVVFTLLFVLMFPRPLALLPPLLTLPVVARIQQILGAEQMPLVDIFLLLYYTALNFILIYVVVYLNSREESQTSEIVELQRELRELAVVEERNRIAREIHDGLGANLSSVVLQADYLAEQTDDRALLKEIGELKSTVEESIDELRRSVSMMRAGLTLAPALEDLCASFHERARDLEVQYSSIGKERKVHPDCQLAVFRVLQEALSNAHRHAEASTVTVEVVYHDDRVELTARDNGRGFDPGQPRAGHFGLLHMEERARRVGGSVTVSSQPGKGTEVRLRVPVDGPEGAVGTEGV